MSSKILIRGCSNLRETVFRSTACSHSSLLNGICGTFDVPVSLWVDEPLSLSRTASAMAAVVLMGLFSTVIAMVIYFRLVRTLGPLGVMAGSYIRAGFSVVLGMTLLGEELPATLIVGLVLVFVGVAIITGHLKPPSHNTTSS